MRPSPQTVEGVREAIRSGAVRDMLDDTAKAAGQHSRFAGIWYYQNGYSCSRDRFSGWNPPSWSCVVQDPPPEAGTAPPKLWDPYILNEQPFLALHKLGSEGEAALAYDYATLWLKLRCKGCTMEQLRAHRWNIPKMRIWEQAHVVKALSKLALEDVKQARTYIRSKVRSQVPQLARLGLHKEAAHRLREEQRKKRRTAAKAERAKQAAAAKAERARQARKAEQEERAAAKAQLLMAKQAAEHKKQLQAARKWKEEAAKERRAAAAKVSSEQDRQRKERRERRASRCRELLRTCSAGIAKRRCM